MVHICGIKISIFRSKNKNDFNTSDICLFLNANFVCLCYCASVCFISWKDVFMFFKMIFLVSNNALLLSYCEVCVLLFFTSLYKLRREFLVGISPRVSGEPISSIWSSPLKGDLHLLQHLPLALFL